MRFVRLRCASVGCLLLLLVACSSTTPRMDANDGTAPPVGEWSLVAFLEHDARPTVTPTLAVHSDGTLAGDAGCNRYTGRWAPSPTLGPLAATRRMCPSEVMAVEDRFLAALSRVAGWRADGDRLWLTDASGRDLLAFAR